MTEAQIIYTIREGVRENSDDSDIDDRTIIHLTNLTRSKFLRNDLNNLQKTTDQSIIQKLCMEIEEVSIDDCNIDEECGTIMRTKLKLPPPLELNLKSAIISIKPSLKLTVPFNFVTKDRAIFSKHSSFNNSIYSFLDSDYHIYLVSESDSIKLLECITVEGIFEEPQLLRNFNNCCGCETPKVCYDPMTTQYPLQAHHVSNITDEIINKLIGRLSLPKDENNNANDN